MGTFMIVERFIPLKKCPVLVLPLYTTSIDCLHVLELLAP